MLERSDLYVIRISRFNQIGSYDVYQHQQYLYLLFPSLLFPIVHRNTSFQARAIILSGSIISNYLCHQFEYLFLNVSYQLKIKQ
jgi:hypothetical protein